MATVFMLATTNAGAQQLHPYCIEGGKYTCFGIQLQTDPDPAGTKVTVRVAVLQPGSSAGAPASVDWARLHAIDFMGPATSFADKWLTTADPAVTPLGSAKVKGDVTERWFTQNIGEDGGDYKGFELFTPYATGGAEMIGCTLPPDITPPYVQTCASGSDINQSAMEFSFTTTGTWNAVDVQIAVEMTDSYGVATGCVIKGAAYDIPETYHCKDMVAPAEPENHVPTAAVDPVSGSPLEGSAVTLDGGRSADADGDALTYSWSFGDGSPDVSGTASKVSHAYADNGVYTVSLIVTDAKGAASTATTTTVTVGNTPPSAILQSPVTLNQGDAVALALANPSDPSAPDIGAGFQYAFDCGSGTLGTFSSNASISCASWQVGPRTVRGEIRDKDGGVGVFSATVTITDVAPTITTFDVPSTAMAGSNVTVSGAFSDPGSLDSWTQSIDWGDGQTTSGSVTNGQAGASHVYTMAGTYTVELRVADDAGGSSIAATRTIAVSTASEATTTGLALGLGVFASPAGALVGQPHLKSLASFGFSVAYQRGTAKPIGLAGFDLKLGALAFAGMSLESLTITETTAQFGGTARSNSDHRQYAFQVSVIDGHKGLLGSGDKIRIRLWDKGTGVIVYDSQPGGEATDAPTLSVQLGNIVVAKPERR